MFYNRSENRPLIYNLLSGDERESKACVDFMLTMAEYCLDGQMRMLGNMMQSQQEQSAPAEIRKISDKTTFDKLPKEFTYDDLRNAKGACKEATYRSTIKRWRQNGMIEDADQGTVKIFRKKVA